MEHHETTSSAPSMPTAADGATDYTFVNTVGRIAVYDDLRSAPRVMEIPPAETASYIDALSMTIYQQAQAIGGTIPHMVIREVSENFIHANFQEILVSILDRGNTIRFADHGPGIASKEKAQQLGFSSASDPMRAYIRGVGSGFPIVREYLEVSNGTITVEDNLGSGTVVTVSLVREQDDPMDDWEEQAGTLTAVAATPAGSGAPVAAPPTSYTAAPTAPMAVSAAAVPVAAPVPAPYPGAFGQPQPYGMPPAAYGQPAAPYPPAVAMTPPSPYPAPQPAYGYAPTTMPAPPLDERTLLFLKMFLSEGALGVTEMQRLTDVPQSSVWNVMEKMEQDGLIQKVGKARILTPYGQQIAQAL